MDILKTPLVILFKEINPYKILSNYFEFDSSEKENHTKINKNSFVNLYQEIEKQVSKDESINIYDIVNEKMNESLHGIRLRKSVFTLLLNYDEKILDNCGNTVRCKYKDLLKWRMATLKLDPDMFICSFLAYEDIMTRTDRKRFDWDTIIKSNNIRLHNMLSKGMAENHFHLKGSAPTFKLTWVSFMNDVHAKNISKENMEKNRLQKDIEEYVDINYLILVAELLRVILFNVLINEEDKETIDRLLESLKDVVNIGIYFSGQCENKDLLNMYATDIQNEINLLRFTYGVRLKYSNKEEIVDYAITDDIDIRSRGIRMFLGERKFLYKCFKEIYSNNRNSEFEKYIDLFYAYLIIKNKVRAELIQENDKVGFTNFSEYQNRKTQYLREGSILKESVEPSAILTSIKTQNIKSIEVRSIPYYKEDDNVKYIDREDKLICNSVIRDNDNFWLTETLKEKLNLNNDEIIKLEQLFSSEMNFLLDSDSVKQVRESILGKYFYVYHFPKKIDKLEEKDKEYFTLNPCCRHYSYRKEIKKCAVAIFQMRENNQLKANRVLGIDACSNELVTRPEVFGQTYRFLKNHLPSNDYLSDFEDIRSLPRLGATYHVGEDFLDVIDGLRAIDEAVTFLELTHGDRLGHAIVLGVDVEEWYNNKLNRVYLSKQSILDNIAWLISKIKEYYIMTSSETIDKLMKIYNKYYREIYTETDENSLVNNRNTRGSNFNVVPVDTYMAAWELRGDNPEVYKHENNEMNLISYWDRCAIRNEENNQLVKELYRRYHYDPMVKVKGYKKEVFKVEQYIIEAVKEVQKCMQIEIRRRGIGIETNPSSNVLISTFKRYDKHPILKFNNLGLDKDSNEDNPQLFVSINTDDQGVFDTLLENEYALMGIALEKVKDSNGKCVYNQANIYDWLDRIREMGLEQSFRIPRD